MTDTKAKVCDFNNLYKAMNKCKKGVSWKDSVSRYCNNGLLSILKLCNSLDDGSYDISPYYEFVIHEPKTRDIISTNFKDRVFQRSYCDNAFYDDVVKTFIYDNSACQVNEGNDFSRRRLKRHMHGYCKKNGCEGYVLKVDMKNYFGSTPHKTIKAELKKVIKHEWELQTCFDVIDSYDSGTQTGVGLGSQITQLVQLLVLSSLDHHMKEVLHVKHYVRYMDDIVIIAKDREYLQYCLSEIDRITKQLGLTLNMKKTQIFKISQGINFLGFTFRISKEGKVYSTLSKKNIKKRKRKIRKHHDLFLKGRMTQAKADECYVSWKAHADNGNTFKVLKSMDVYYNKIWEEQNVQKTYRKRTVA